MTMVMALAACAAAVPGQAPPLVGILEATLTQSPYEPGSNFSVGSAVSGDTAVVGAWLADNDGLQDAGKAFVFVRNGNSWTQQAELTPLDAAADDRFGLAVAVLDDTIVVSSYRDDNERGQDAGAVYVFTRTGATWVQQAKLIAADGTPDDLFGYSVALSGESLVVGAIFDSNPGAGGSAYVFARSGSTWSQQAKLTASDASSGDFFGQTVAISADTVVVGAEYENEGGSQAGAAYVFVRNGSLWSQQAKLMASDATPSSLFGSKVAASGDTVLIGAPGTITGTGAAYVFTRTGTSWTEQATLAGADMAIGDSFGGWVALQGDLAVVAAPLDDYGGWTDSGSFYVFTRDGSGWTEAAKLTSTSPAANFGAPVALEGDTVLVGTDAGGPSFPSVHVYRLVSIGMWSSLGLGLPGTAGIPALAGTGYLVAGFPVAFGLTQAKPFSFAPFVAGISNISAPFKGGVMVPNPDFIFPAFTDFNGASAFGGLWPSGVPSGFTTYFQWWIQDPAGPKGFAASNALAGTTP